MRVAIIGAGPAGLFIGAALANRGHRVTLVDRDPGPADGGTWPRRGVMQFHHAHTFRRQVADALNAELPEAFRAWVEAGAEPVVAAFGGRDEVLIGVRSRRVTFETALRAVAERTPGLRICRGHVEGIVVRAGSAAGLRVDGGTVAADLVVDASGRAGRASRSLGQRRSIGGGCGIAYVDRQYRLRPGAEGGSSSNPVGFQGVYDGYMVLIFPHEHRIFSTVIIRSTANRDLMELRHERAFSAAARAIPILAEWTDPARSQPLTPVLPGGALMNVYRGQVSADGRLILPGLIFLGDSVCTTTPNFGRGVATTMMQCTELLRLLDAAGGDLGDIALAFDKWCETAMRPWVEDHVKMDAGLADRWNGSDIDLAEPLPSDLIMAAADVDRTIGALIGPYLAMQAGPDSLRAVEPVARAVFASGWRPIPPPGPSGRELSKIVIGALRGP